MQSSGTLWGPRWYILIWEDGGRWGEWLDNFIPHSSVVRDYLYASGKFAEIYEIRYQPKNDSGRREFVAKVLKYMHYISLYQFLFNWSTNTINLISGNWYMYIVFKRWLFLWFFKRDHLKRIKWACEQR